jgi:hypothetical protein
MISSRIKKLFLFVINSNIITFPITDHTKHLPKDEKRKEFLHPIKDTCKKLQYSIWVSLVSFYFFRYCLQNENLMKNIQEFVQNKIVIAILMHQHYIFFTFPIYVMYNFSFLYKQTNSLIYILLKTKEKKSRKLVSLAEKFDQDVQNHAWKCFYTFLKYCVLIILLNYKFDHLLIVIFSTFFKFRILEKLIQSYEIFLSEYKPWAL